MQKFLTLLYGRLTLAALEGLVKRHKRKKTNGETNENRLLYIPASSLPYHISGYTTRTHEVICALKEVGADVCVLSRPGYPWDRGDRVANTDALTTHVDNVTYHHVQSPSKHRPLLMFALQAAAAIAQAAIREKASVIHAASNHENALPALLAARRLGIPFHYEMRGLWELTRSSRIPGYKNSAGFQVGLELEGFVATHADRVFVISEQLGKFARQRWGIPQDHFELLPNCVDPNRITVSDPGKIIPNTIGYAGSLISYEGLDTLIDAIAILLKQGVDVRVNIIGDGEARSELEDQVQRLGLSDNIHFSGRVAPETARDLLGRSALVCIPRKPFTVCKIVPPIKLVEALAMGKPVIVPDLPVFRDEVGDSRAGWFFKAGDAVDLACVIHEALKNPAQLGACGERAREYSSTQRCWRNFVTNVVPEVNQDARNGN